MFGWEVQKDVFSEFYILALRIGQFIWIDKYGPDWDDPVTLYTIQQKLWQLN